VLFAPLRDIRFFATGVHVVESVFPLGLRVENSFTFQPSPKLPLSLLEPAGLGRFEGRSSY